MREKEILRRVGPLLERVYAIDRMKQYGSTPIENIKLSTEKSDALKTLPSFSPLEVIVGAEPKKHKTIDNPYTGRSQDLHVLECEDERFFVFEKTYEGMRTYYHDGKSAYVTTDWFPPMNGHKNGKRKYSYKRRR